MIGDNIKKYRLEIGLTQNGLAKLLGYSRQTIYNWEQNKSIPSTKDICTICSIFRVQPNQIIGEVEDYDKTRNDGECNE